MRTLIFVALCVAALTGCQSRSATVTFTPSALKDCGPNNAASAVEVHWDASQAKADHGVKLWVSKSAKPQRTGVFGGDPGTLWLQGADVGSSTTGVWMYAGTTITVTDAENGDTLATAKVPSAACK